ncbi:asparaginase [Pseudomonas monteilii]|uniref:asparaginase n=1 Tax=Pseudomonas monteilii TaxID=76759 RepID=UPI000760E320|nr:asparaginase [Pseudomonas monteilii]
MSEKTRLPRLSLGCLGGTVSMQPASPGKGITPSLEGDDLLAAIPQLAALAKITSVTLCLLPSASLTFQIMLDVLAWARGEVERGAQAVVLTQGTDTLEESAYLLDRLWPYDIPLVMTGAMRGASQPGNDGPANLLAAVQVALSINSHGRGVLVVINDQIHQAAHVRKTASMAMAAFESPGYGLEGCVVEGRVLYRCSAAPRRVLAPPQRCDQRVALIEACLDADIALLETISALGYEGLVVAGFGAGHVSAAWSEALARIARDMPVIVASRTGCGPTAGATYGFVGAEIDLQAKGVYMAGMLCPRKCRVLLWLLIGQSNPVALPDWLAH